MGTRFRLTLSAPDEVTAHQRFDECRALLNSLENEWSPWIEGSDVWRINNAGAGRVDVSPHTYDLISRSLTVSELTRGAFDITFASVGHLYRYREHIRPSDTARKDALTKVSYKNLKLEPNHQLVLLKDGIRVDLGGVAKGESIEQLKALLLSKGIRSAYFSLGGDSYVLGKKGEYPWMLGIKHPRKEKEVIARIPLENIAVSTSGDYERFFMDEGTRVHHILSPVSGLPADEVMSVTVMGPDAWKTDALSTSVFIMGIKPGIQLIESLSGYDVIVVDKTGQIFASKGLVSPSNPK
ncbi:FAD:protein FMN transferase [Litoribrevibacter albus]|uniref:FAD:protein FMN transferase n=2 Tax=Litoribrevibacter albus TaxID=1473156 RepID=A0AA37W683_9GAMM|nr:FAD:protein FMN transferase [Litoribrevibacter albus]